MNNLILNRCAIWQPKNIDSLTFREYPAGRVYFENNVAKTASSSLWRYAKNYTMKSGKTEIKFCLFVVVTYVQPIERVESFLDNVANSVDLGIAQKVAATGSIGNFQYLDNFYKGGE